jgi:hypothetical protein
VTRDGACMLIARVAKDKDLVRKLYTSRHATEKGKPLHVLRRVVVDRKFVILNGLKCLKIAYPIMVI